MLNNSTREVFLKHILPLLNRGHHQPSTSKRQYSLLNRFTLHLAFPLNIRMSPMLMRGQRPEHLRLAHHRRENKLLHSPRGGANKEHHQLRTPLTPGLHTDPQQKLQDHFCQYLRTTLHQVSGSAQDRLRPLLRYTLRKNDISKRRSTVTLRPSSKLFQL